MEGKNMFCMKCGKQIDDDSAFCPYCGGKVGGGITAEVPPVEIKNHNGINKKLIISLAGCLAVVLVVVGVIKLFSGGIGDTIAEQLFLMSWEELVELDDKELKSQLRDEGITYEQDDSELSSSLFTESVSPFMDYDCIFGYTNPFFFEAYGMTSFELPQSAFIIPFDTQDDYKDGKDDLLKYLNKNQSKVCDVIPTEQDDMEAYMYLLDVSTDNLEAYVDCYEDTAKKFYKEYGNLDEDFGVDPEEGLINLEDRLGEIKENLSDYKIYKFCVIACGNIKDLTESASEGLSEGNDFSIDLDDYYDYGCIMYTQYLCMTDDGFCKYMAQFNYDTIAKQTIDIEEVRKTIDVDLLDEKIQDSERSLRAIYFIENHDMSINNDMDVSTDELKKIWYLETFGWDNEALEFVDLADYNNSADIYCAVTYNYNLDDYTYFESELDKAVYLSDMNYNSDTGTYFESDDEKRLWFLKNYSYDTVSQKTVEADVIEALLAYVEYSEEVLSEEGIYGYNLIYIDDNDIPECLVWTEYDQRVYVLSYQNGSIESVTTQMSSSYTSVSYTPKLGKFKISVFYGSAGLEDDIFTLDDSFDWVLYADSNRAYSAPGESYYILSINGKEVSGSVYEEEFSKNDFEAEYTITGGTAHMDNGETYSSILAAYDALRTKTYHANLPEITEFELSDGILTVSAGDGSRFGWNSHIEEFSFSYPVSDDCTWEDGWYAVNSTEFECNTYISYDIMKEDIDSTQEKYKEGIEQYGSDFEINSPYGFTFNIIDETVVSVYRLSS